MLRLSGTGRGALEELKMVTQLQQLKDSKYNKNDSSK